MRSAHYLLSLSVILSCTVVHAADVASPSQSAKPKAQAKRVAKKKAPVLNTKIDQNAGFKEKLAIMYNRVEKSTQLLREQIIRNQSAPFLADLYLQLADLLSEKSNILYYQQMEKDKSSDLKIDSKQKLNPIVTSQQEAIEIYRQILKEFPAYTKRDKVLYRLAIALKSIDEGPAFVVTSELLLKDYPKTKESMQVRILMGQYYFDMQDYKAASEVLLVAQGCEFPYERNAARYRLGLIRMNEEKFAEALGYFEKIATDDELKEDDNPLEVSIQTRTVNSNIKREALIDSIRAYTEVYKKNPDPIAFYNRVAPTEILFQEVIEKLAYRYIFLKNQSQALVLLRTLSERVADPQKVVNIYQDVLLMIPPIDRIDVPAREMQFVLQKYNDWTSYFDVPEKTRQESYKFLETQVRDIGTRNHDLGKSELSTSRKDLLYERARNFYHLYLGFFEKGPQAVKIATNLADVYYYQKNYLRAGDFYLRVFQGEFGAPEAKESLIQNAILCFQKPAPNDFYEIVRNRGLLVKAIQSYMSTDASKKNDPKLNFILVKSTYDQGLYATALNDLVSFIGKYPKAETQVDSAVDIGLDYYNIRSDFKGLVSWSQKVLAISAISPKLRSRLEGVKSKAMLKQVDEIVKSKANYDAFAQGKVYFETALNMQDESMKSAVLEQALARSKAEKDIGTFLSAANAMAKAEKNANKRASILLGMAEQMLAIGRFYQTLETWQQVANDSQTPDALKKQVREKTLRLSIMLKDWKRASVAMNAGASDALRQSAISQMGLYADTGVENPAVSLASVKFDSMSTEELLPFFKGQFKLTRDMQSEILAATQKACAAKPDSLLCRWAFARTVPARVVGFSNQLQSAPADLQSIEPQALKMNQLLTSFKRIEETGEPTLDIFTSLHKARVYQSFAQYLKRVGIANKQVAQVLDTKASESMQNAKQEYIQCTKVITASSLMSPINKFCLSQKEPGLKDALTWRNLVKDSPESADPKSKVTDDLQKQIFVDATKPEPYLELATKYLEGRHYRHAIAMANYGTSTFPQQKDDFAVIAGCGLVKMGMYAEAAFYLNSGGESPLKAPCLAALKAGTQ